MYLRYQNLRFGKLFFLKTCTNEADLDKTDTLVPLTRNAVLKNFLDIIV